MNNENADKTVQAHMLICIFVDHIWDKQVLSWRSLIIMIKDLQSKSISQGDTWLSYWNRCMQCIPEL